MAGQCDRQLSSTSVDLDVCIARLLPTGAPDEGFDNDGKVLSDVGSTRDTVAQVLIEPDDQVLVVGGTCCDGSFMVARYGVNGDLDPSFDQDGIAVVPGGVAQAAALDPTGRIVVAGSNSGNIRAIRFSDVGTPDASFAETPFNFGSAFDGASGMVLQPDGKPVISGLTKTGADFDFATARLQADESAPPPIAQSDSDTQTTTASVPSEEGVLTIAVGQATVDFGSVPKGTTSVPAAVGDIVYTNTLASANTWFATVAATALTSGANRIDFEQIALVSSGSVSPVEDGMTIGSPGPFAGGDPSGYSGSRALLTAPGTAKDTFTHSGIKAALSVPGAQPSAANYQGTLQYTITD